MGRSGTRTSRERWRPAGGTETAKLLAVETTALPGSARGDASPTGRGVSSFKLDVSSCWWRSVECGGREIRRTKPEIRKKSEDRWPKSEGRALIGSVAETSPPSP